MTGALGIFAERRLRLRSIGSVQNISVQLGPVVREGQAVFCRYCIIGFEEPVSKEIWGLDDIQAVQLALSAIGADLDRLGGDGQYGVEDDADGEVGHGFPALVL